jgi:hypothetical protein
VSDQVLLRDLVAIPDTVHDSDFVRTLAKGVQAKSTITDYVVTEPLAANFDKALDLIKSALETGASRAASLNGSFGSGKSPFMAILHAAFGQSPAEDCDGYLTGERESRNLTEDALRAWTPPQPQPGRRARTSEVTDSHEPQ